MKKSWAYPEIKKGYPRTFSPDKEKRQEESFIPSVSGSYADAAGEENERGKKRKTTTGNKKKKYVSVKKVQERAAGRKKIYPLKKFPVKIFTGETDRGGASIGKYGEKRFPEKAKYRYITLPDRKKKIPPEEKWNREILFFKDGKELFTVPDPGKKGQTAKGKKILKKFFPSVKKHESRFGNILQRGRTNVKINNRKEWKYNGNDLKKRMTKMLWQKSGKDIFLSGRMAEFSGEKFLQPRSSPLSSLSGMVFLVRELEKTRTGPAGDLSDDRIFSLIKHYMDENIPSESV
ncbi:MAG: hypothetical protein IKA79_05905 [Lentisphaeria bacterium]|nr:hypothetical protein [Lentisphaeria bacterium]